MRHSGTPSFPPSNNFNLDLEAATVQDVKNAGRDGKKHPEMLYRVMSALMHLFIHLEFGIPGQVAEGEPDFSIVKYHLSILNRNRPGSH